MIPRTVLLIDSDPDSLQIYSTILEHHGFRVLCASEGEQGFRMAVEAQPHAIVMEPFTPAPGGQSVAMLLQQDQRTAAIPMLLLTSMPGRLGALRLEAHVRRPFAKPLQPRRLAQEVEQLLGPVAAMV